jgi:hypothetical protein
MRRALTLASVLLAGFLQAPSARADEPDRVPAAEATPMGPRPENQLLVQNTLIACVNPAGLVDLAEIGYRRRLYATASPALADNFVGIGVVPTVSPAFVRAGPVLEVQPASVLSLAASYEEIRFFGNFNSLESFASPLADYDDAERLRRGQLPAGSPDAPYAAHGTQLNLAGTLQAKVGPFAARGTARFMRPDYDVRAGDRVVYDPAYDVLVPNRGWFMSQDVDAVYMTDGGLVAGARWTSTFAFYRASDFAPGEVPHNPNTPMHRLGPVVAYSFWKHRGGVFDDPTVFLMSAWWLSHRYRTGAEGSPAVPLVAVGFQFTGDLLPALTRRAASHHGELAGRTSGPRDLE